VIRLICDAATANFKLFRSAILNQLPANSIAMHKTCDMHLGWQDSHSHHYSNCTEKNVTTNCETVKHCFFKTLF
jgi:hypothetical protein